MFPKSIGLHLGLASGQQVCGPLIQRTLILSQTHVGCDHNEAFVYRKEVRRALFSIGKRASDLGRKWDGYCTTSLVSRVTL